MLRLGVQQLLDHSIATIQAKMAWQIFLVLLGYLNDPGVMGAEGNLSLFDEMQRNPLSKNPFFATIMGGQFNANGREGIEPAFSGYFCKLLGNLECSDFDMECEGRGMIDCTGQCPGDVSMLEDMFAKLENAEFMADYPLMAAMMNKTKESSDSKAGSGGIKEVLKKCGFSKYLALLALKDGPGFGEITNDTVASVDKEAVSGFGDYSYDYEESDDLDQDASEDSDPEPEAEPEQSENSNQTQTPEAVPESQRLEARLFADGAVIPDNTTRIDESNEVLARKSPKRESDVLGVEKSESKSQRRRGKRLRSRSRSTRHLKMDLKLGRLESLDEEVAEFRGLLLQALDDLENESRRSKRDLGRQESTYSEMRTLFQAMGSHQRRFARSLIENSTDPELEVEAEKCVVKNLSCVRFPTTNQCSGIGVGGCVTRTQALAILFSPRVIIVLIAIVLALAAAIVTLAYYLYKRKRANVVEPVEINRNDWPSGHVAPDPKHKLVKQVPFHNDIEEPQMHQADPETPRSDEINH